MNLSGRLVLGNPATRIFHRAMDIGSDPLTQTEQYRQECSDRNPRFKGGKDLVRFQLEKDESEWPIEVSDATLNLAGFLQMCRGETPLTGAYDVVIALGGARRSPLHRACYAAQAVVDGRAEAKLIVIAGSTRPLNDQEKSIAQDYAPNAETEFDLCLGAEKKLKDRYPTLRTESICKTDPKSENDGVIDEVMSSCKAHYTWQTPLRVAIVTTRIYALGLHLDMARAARRYNWGNFMAAGHCSDPEVIFNRTTSTYLSECLITLRKAALAAAEGC